MHEVVYLNGRLMFHFTLCVIFEGSVHCVCLTPHNEYVISGCSKNIIIWDLVAGTAELKIESAHAEKVTCLTEIAEDTFASASSDAYLKMWTIDGELTHSVTTLVVPNFLVKLGESCVFFWNHVTKIL